MPLSRVILAVLALILVGVDGMAFEDWQCGSEEVSKKFAYDSVHENCPSLAAEMNHCCVVHDECYARQLGQTFCDDEFCACNKRVLNNTEGQGCRANADIVCLMMPFVGMYAYDNSVNYTEPEHLPKHSPAHPVIEEPYSTLFGRCHSINSTLTSCAIQFDECSKTEEECAAQLCSCMFDAARLADIKDCHEGTEAVCLLALKTALHGKWYQKISVMTLSCLLLLAGCVLCTYHMFCRWTKKKQYSQVTECFCRRALDAPQYTHI